MNDTRRPSQIDQDRLQTLVAEYVRRIDAGDEIDRHEFIAPHPDMADAFCEYLDSPAFVLRLIAEGGTLSGNGVESRAQSPGTGDTILPTATRPQAGGVQPVPERFGRYRIVKELGHGAMGSVYLAEDTELRRRVALKIPKFSPQADSYVLKRFYREARTAATLSHPNICPVFDVGEHDGRYFIAMGYVEGRPLQDYVKSGKRQPERRVASVIRKVALALDEAHRQGILHRDLKPANIMIDQRREPIVMDFGLAYRMDDNSESRLTQDGCIVGTPAYMSPEQIDNRSEVGPASDIYSLGVLFYELLTGQCPFAGSVASVIGQVLHVTPKAVAELRPDVRAELADICERAMAKNAQDRYASMNEFAEALKAFLKGEASADSSAALVPLDDSHHLDLQAIHEPMPPPLHATGGPHSPLATARYTKAPAKTTNHAPWLIAGGAAGLLAILVLLTVAVSGWMSGENENPSTSESAQDNSAKSSDTEQLKEPQKPAEGPASHESTTAGEAQSGTVDSVSAQDTGTTTLSSVSATDATVDDVGSSAEPIPDSAKPSDIEQAKQRLKPAFKLAPRDEIESAYEKPKDRFFDPRPNDRGSVGTGGKRGGRFRGRGRPGGGGFPGEPRVRPKAKPPRKPGY